jgi:hypothetical protein
VTDVNSGAIDKMMKDDLVSEIKDEVIVSSGKRG